MNIERGARSSSFLPGMVRNGVFGVFFEDIRILGQREEVRCFAPLFFGEGAGVFETGWAGPFATGHLACRALSLCGSSFSLYMIPGLCLI